MDNSAFGWVVVDERPNAEETGVKNLRPQPFHHHCDWNRYINISASINLELFEMLSLFSIISLIKTQIWYTSDS